MALISEEDIQRVREANDLVTIFQEYVPLRQRGRDFWCCCPFHQEKTPSCKIDTATQIWHCFGCGEGGDIFNFIQKIEDITFPEAVSELAERAHITLTNAPGSGISSSQKARLREVCAATEKFYHTHLMRGKSLEADKARAYLASRGLGGSVPKKWSLGFAPGGNALIQYLQSLGFTPKEMLDANVAAKQYEGGLTDRFFDRVMFPICDSQGDCIAFGGRVIGEGNPKYLNSQETPLFHKSNVLFGLDKAKASMTTTGDAIVVEGYTDVITLHEKGITNVVATLGTALTLQHVRILSRHASKRIIYLFDGDEAGQRAADRALGFINEDMTPEAGKTRVELFAVTLPDNLDPADFVSERGADALKELLDTAMPLILYGIERRLAAHDLSTIEGKTRAFPDALSVLAPIKDSLLAKDYAVQLAGKLQIREDDALRALASLRSQTYAEILESKKGPVDEEDDDLAGLSESEKSRRQIEQKLLTLLAQNPSYALVHADALVQTKWHDNNNAQIAKELLNTLEKQPDITPAALISAITQSCPEASGILTSFGAETNNSLSETLNFLIEEIQIGDMEDEIVVMNSQLKGENDLDELERDLIFRSLVDLQKTLNAKRVAHKPMI